MVTGCALILRTMLELTITRSNSMKFGTGMEVQSAELDVRRLLDEISPASEEPVAVAVDRETIELVFIAALQTLPPRQRLQR